MRQFEEVQLEMNQVLSQLNANFDSKLRRELLRKLRQLLAEADDIIEIEGDVAA